MKKRLSIRSMLGSTLVLIISLTPQTAAQENNARTAPSLTRVLVAGDATVQAQPDTATILIAVVTQNQSALAAQQQNADKSDAVMRAIRAATGEGAEVKTSGYNLQPQRIYRENQPPTIVGYEARNGVIVTMSDLSKVGSVIDVASRAGANSVDNLLFTLRRDRPARDQALSEAIREAVSKAQAIAQALGGRVMRIVEVQEASMARIPVIYDREVSRVANTAIAAPTPIEVGSLDVKSQVQLIAEIEARQQPER